MTKNSLSSLLALPLLALPAVMMAQPVYTDPVGAVSTNYTPGGHVTSFPFQHSKTFQGTVSSVAGASVELSGAVPAEVGTSPHYLQVLSGSAAGSVASVSAVSASGVTIESAIVGLSLDDSVALRAHTTLSDLSGSAVAFPDDSVVTFYNRTGVSESYIFAEGDWYENFGDFNLANETVVFPGEGFVLGLPGSVPSVDIVFTGSVSVDPVRVPLGPAFSVVGMLNPAPNTTSDTSLKASLGNVGNDTIVSTYSADGSLVLGDSYIFAEGDWYENFGDFNFANNVVVAAPRAVFVSPTSSVEVVIPPAFIQQN